MRHRRTGEWLARLREHGLHDGEHGWLMRSRNSSRDVAEEMHLASLPRCISEAGSKGGL
jgi:hypothetical protein